MRRTIKREDMNDGMRSEGAGSIQSTAAMGAGIQRWMQLSTFILK